MDAVKLMERSWETAEATKEKNSIGCTKLVVFCNAPTTTRSWPGRFTVSPRLMQLSTWV